MFKLHKIKQSIIRLEIAVKVPFIKYRCKHITKLLDPPLTYAEYNKSKTHKVVCERCNKRMVI